MTRVEFTAKTKDQAHARFGGHCGKCGAVLQSGKTHYDHILPCGLGGTNELANCMPLCEPCHKNKTAQEDIPRIRKADRQRRAHIGAKVAKTPIQSTGFAKAERQPRNGAAKIDKSVFEPLPRRNPLTREIIR